MYRGIRLHKTQILCLNARYLYADSLHSDDEALHSDDEALHSTPMRYTQTMKRYINILRLTALLVLLPAERLKRIIRLF